jgi:uncharacterized membrane protein YedE/YeeE
MAPLDNSVWEFGQVVLALVMGFFFGWALDKGGMTRYHKIVNVFRFTDLAVLKFMMSAMVTGLIGIYLLVWAGQVELTAITPTIPIKNLAGGLLFGVGMALVGMCPGTAVAGAARGQLDYLIPGLGGFLTGGLTYGLLYPTINSLFDGFKDYGNAKLPELWHMSSALTVYVFALMIMLMLYTIAKLNLRRQDRVSPDAAES